MALQGRTHGTGTMPRLNPDTNWLSAAGLVALFGKGGEPVTAVLTCADFSREVWGDDPGTNLVLVPEAVSVFMLPCVGELLQESIPNG